MTEQTFSDPIAHGLTDRTRVRYPRHSLPMTSFGKPPHIFLKLVTRPNPLRPTIKPAAASGTRLAVC
jgi:hypothetical protein